MGRYERHRNQSRRNDVAWTSASFHAWFPCRSGPNPLRSFCYGLRLRFRKALRRTMALLRRQLSSFEKRYGMGKLRITTAWIIASACLLLGAVPCAGQVYVLTDLGSLGQSSEGVDVNTSGQ